MSEKIMVEKIQKSFSSLSIDIEHEKIRQELSKKKRLGVTNEFIELNSRGEQYIVRLNGQLWPPYKREDETNTLSLLRKLNIDTSVLQSQPSFQICINHRKRFDSQSYFDAIRNEKSQARKVIIEAVATHIAKYHTGKVTNGVEYPLSKMIMDAMYNAQNKLGMLPDELIIFNEISKRILSRIYQKNYSENLVFSHNDLLAKSVYATQGENLSIIIVDWEYSAMGPWTTDLSLLTWGECESGFLELATCYFMKRGWSDIDNNLIELRLGRFLHGYLSLLWKCTKDNIHLPSTGKMFHKLRNELQAAAFLGYIYKSPDKLYFDYRKSVLLQVHMKNHKMLC